MLRLNCFAFLLLCISAQAQKKNSFEKEIFTMEMSFSKDSKDSGFLSANMKYAADDAIVFRPRLVNAKEWTKKLMGTDTSYQITWYPSFIETSAAGDLGYATGPFDNVSKIPGDSSENHGQFLTVWKRQEDGSLKFVIDFGSNQLPRSEFVKKEPVFENFTEKRKYKTEDQVKSLQEIFSIEKEFNESCERDGDLLAYKQYADKEIRFYYQRGFYVKGLNNVVSRLENIKGHHSWKPLNGFVSISGDLAYVYGTHEFREEEKLRTGYYLRIWRKKGKDWVIVAQVRSLL